MQKLLKKVNKITEMFFNNIKIQKKFLISYMLIIAMILVLGIGLSYFSIYKFYTGQIRDVSENAFMQTENSLESMVQSNLYAAYIVQNSEEVQKIYLDEEKDIMAQYEDMKRISNYIFSIAAPLSINQITLYVPDERVYSNNNLYFRKHSDLEQYDAYRLLKNSSDIYTWMKTEYVSEDNLSNYILVNSILRKIGDNTNPVGYQRVSIRNSTISKMVEKGKYVEKGTVFLYDNLYDEVISPVEDMDILQIAEELSMNDVKYVDYREWKSVDVDGEMQQVRMSRIDSTDWILVSMYPESYSKIMVLQQYLIWIFAALIIGILTIILSYWLSKSMTRRIHILDYHMTELAEGKGVLITEDDGTDEIGNLIQNYNLTLQKLKEYMEKIVEDGKRIQESDLKLLQSQINPHFLYNTLDLIHWEALNHEVPQISDITQTLAQFYKLSLNQGREMVRIREEINHVISYLEIQNYRYGNKIIFDVQIPAKMMEYQIIKITLQPLIENAIQHGLRNRDNMEGAEIVIDGWIEQEYIYIQITDNGIGISEEKLENILDSKESDDMHGFGIHNIQERLQLKYGKACGLSYESTLGMGTTVTVKIKAEKYTEEK